MHPFYSGKFNLKLTLITLLGCHCLVQSAAAQQLSQNEFSFGLGLGALYAGLGVNFGVRSNYDFKYAAIGCTSVRYSSTNHTNASCGGSVGWLWTGVVAPDDRKHSFGAYVGPLSLVAAMLTMRFMARALPMSSFPEV